MNEKKLLEGLAWFLQNCKAQAEFIAEEGKKENMPTGTWHGGASFAYEQCYKDIVSVIEKVGVKFQKTAKEKEGTRQVAS